MIPVKLLFMAHIQYLGSAWRNYIRSILLHSQFRAIIGVFGPGYTLTADTTDPDQDQNIPGLSPSHLEMEIAEYYISWPVTTTG